jgi:spermidine synthase
LVAAIFVASGAAGLIYQVVWSRELVLVFGNTTQAISTIVTAFMLGLGAGGYVGGRLALRSRNPLRFYGFIELLVALFALMLPVAFDSFGEVYRAAYGAMDVTALSFVRAGLALLAVTPATFLMGMTLPVLTRFMVRTLDRAGNQLAKLYAANTFGAVLGTLVSGFLLIELLGLTGTAHVAVLLNVIAGGSAIFLSTRSFATAAMGGVERAEPAPEPNGLQYASTRRRRIIFLATFVSGMVALALEVLWTRMLAEGSGSRIYVFVAILAIYLAGIALGSALYNRLGNARRDTLGTVGLCLGGIGLSAMVTVVLGSGVLIPPPGWLAYFILVPATLLMGYAFPLCGRLAMRNAQEAASTVGLLYTWNTAGSIIGSFAAAFILAGTIGTNGSILLLAAANLALGAWLVALDSRQPSAVSLQPSVVGRRSSPSIGWLPLVATMLLLAVVAVLAVVAQLPIASTITENTLRAAGYPYVHMEDELATVDSQGGPLAQRKLLVSGTGMTVLTIDTKLMAYLPKALRPNAKDFLVICFGMGTTYRSSLILGMHTDAVELSPSVPKMMPMYYDDAGKYLNDPNGRVIVADGRNYVRLSSNKYDLIAVDPAPPIQSAGTVVLYTREFFEQAKQRLNPGGVFMLWVPYTEPVSDFKDHLRTFRSAFDHVRVLFGPVGYGLYMLGSSGDLNFDDATVQQVFGSPQAQADLAGAPDFQRLDGQGWAAKVKQLEWLQDAQVDAFVGPGPLITDDRPRTEYFLLRTAMMTDKADMSEGMLRALAPPGGAK